MTELLRPLAPSPARMVLSNSSTTPASFAGAVVAWGLLLAPAFPQSTVPATTMVPAVRIQTSVPAQRAVAPSGSAVPAAGGPAAATASGAAAPPLSPLELQDIKREYDAGSDEDRAALRAFYKDMGIDLEKALSGEAMGGAPVATSLLQAVKALDFTRTPQAVLAARSQIGFGTTKKPEPGDFAASAKWLHLQVMAGEWQAFAQALGEAPPSEATAIYTHVLQTINKPPRNDPNAKADPALLPEEVLAIADAAPGELSDWQVDVLAGLVKSAATKYSTAPMLASIASGTRSFGKQDDAHRERTVRFLVAAGLIVEASAYFPSLDEARAKGDAAALLNHGRYHETFAKSRGAAEGEAHLRTAWGIYAEVALIDQAEAALRQEAMRRAIDLLPSMPPLQASKWLHQVFASESLAPAALEIIALKAVSLRNANLDVAQRAQTILTMKESVDTLLAQTGIDINKLKVPLRMLTTALVAEAETALEGGGNPNARRGPVMPAEMELLLRALPDERWLGALEPSLASRAYRAAILIATAADEVDIALDYLAHGVKRFPDQAVEFADQFLRRWQTRMAPQNYFGDDPMYFVGFVRNDVSSAPLTRGRQRRNLERLTRLMNVLDSIGVESRNLPSVAGVFKSCHGNTEVFTREGIENVFGPVAKLSPQTASSLADQMRGGLSGDWRDRRAQQAAGMKRTAAEVSAMVEQGYALAIELIDRAIAVEPQSWRHAVVKAGLTYDRVQFKQAEEKQDFATYNQYRKEAFEAFAQTADRYAEMVASGDQRDDPSVYLAWFNAAVGATELNYLTRDDLLVEGSPQDDQIDRIRKAIGTLPPDAASRHVGAFARAITDSLGRLDPEVKPRVVRHAMRIIGDHPAGASLRRLTDLYQDLVKDEIKMRLAVDGEDRVGSENRFAVTLTLRFTTAVDRETGGFSRYLQNDVWARVGNTYRPMNYRDLLRKSIEGSFGDRFQVEGVGFFEAMSPPRPVTEGGEQGWLEKPLAYVVLKVKDPSVDRIPQVSIDMHFNDTVGPVTLPILSNSPPIDASGSAPPRPLKGLEVTQTLDLRDMENADKGRSVVLEVHAKGDGVIPELETLLPNYKAALAGYQVGEKGVEVRPFNIVQDDADASQRYLYMASSQQNDKPALEPDEAGRYRLTTERSWLVTYTPASGEIGSEFVLPTLGSGIDGKLVSRQFADMDIVSVAGLGVPVHATLWSPRNIILMAAIGVGLVSSLVVALRRRKPEERADDLGLPARVTPLSVITTLRRIREERATQLDAAEQASLGAEIAALEKRYFGPSGEVSANGELKSVLERWAVAARR